MFDPDPTLVTLLQATVNSGASDLHLTVGRAPTARRDGTLVSFENVKVLEPDDTERMVYSLLNETQEQELDGGPGGRQNDLAPESEAQRRGDGAVDEDEERRQTHLQVAELDVLRRAHRVAPATRPSSTSTTRRATRRAWPGS